MTEVSLVIVTFERLESTKRCLEALRRHCDHDCVQVIVDNNSREEVRQMVLTSGGTRLFLEENQGLYRALNLGLTLVRTELVAFLDTDIVVTSGWLTPLVDEVCRDEAVGLAGARYLNRDGTLQEGLPELSVDGWYGSNRQDPSSPQDCSYIAIGCSVFRKSAWERVGGFDEGYFISHGDIDFCYKLRYEGGYRLRYVPETSVIHDRDYFKEPLYEEQRFNRLRVQQDYKLFRKKWEKVYRREREEEVRS